MAIAATNKATNGNDAAQTSYATASHTPAANQLLLAWVHSSVAAGTPNAPTLSGNGGTWVQVATILLASDTKKRLTLFRFMASAPSAGATTIDFAGQSQERCAWSIVQFSGTSTSGTNGSGAVVQSVTASGNGVASLSITLAALASAANASAGGMAFATLGAIAVSPGAGYTEIAESDSAARSIESEYKPAGSTTVDWSWTGNTAPMGIAVELKFGHDAAAEQPTAAFAGQAPKANIGASPAAPSAAFVAGDADGGIGAPANSPTATFTAFNATVSTIPMTNAPAGAGAVPFVANDPDGGIAPRPSSATAAFVANDPDGGIGVRPSAGAFSFVANDPDGGIGVRPGAGAFSFTAFNATKSVQARAQHAAIGFQAFNPTVAITEGIRGRVLVAGDSAAWQYAGIADPFGLGAFAAQFGITSSPRGLASKGFDVVNVAIPGSGSAREDYLDPITWADSHLLGLLMDVFAPEKVVIGLHGNATVFNPEHTGPEPWGTARHFLLTIAGFQDVLEDARSRREDDDIVVVAGIRVGPWEMGWEWANALTEISRYIVDSVMPAYPAVHVVDLGDIDPWDARLRTSDTIHLTDEGSSLVADRIARELTGVTPGTSTPPPPAEPPVPAPVPGGVIPMPVTPPVVVERAPMVTARFRSTITESHKATVKIDVRPLDLPDVLANLPVKDGTLTWDRDDPIHRSATLDVIDDGSGRELSRADGSELFRAFLTDVRVWRGVQYPDGTEELKSLALLKVTDYTYADRTHSLTLYDPSIRARQELGEPVFVTAGSSVKDVATKLIQRKAPTLALALPDTGDETPALLIPASANGWEEAWKLYRSSGYYLEVDRNGIAVATLAVAGPPEVAAWTFAEDDRDVMWNLKRTESSDGVPNHIVVKGTHPNVSGVIGEAFDDDPASPTFVGRIGFVTKTFEDENVTTSSQATRAAVLLLTRVLGSSVKTSAEIIPNPALELDQGVHLDRPSIDLDSLELLDHMELPLGTGSSMPVDFRRSVRSDAELIGSVL